MLVEPAFKIVPARFATLGPEVVRLCTAIGYKPDPEQALALDAIFAIDGNGRSVSFDIGVICPRQNLKTGLLKQAVLGWLFVTDVRLVVWSAHEARTAEEAFRDLDQLIDSSPLLRSKVKHVYRGNGDESIELWSGARVIFKTRTKGGGRGLSGDKVVLDEAFALQPEHMGALLPTLSARPDPQVLVASSAGLVTSAVLRQLRDRGRKGVDPRLTYLEWCADTTCTHFDCKHAVGEPGCALDVVANWQAANPAMGRRISVEYIAAERRSMPPLQFARERLGWWDEPGVEKRIISDRLWTDVEGPDADVAEVQAFAVAVDPDRAWSSIGVAGVSVHDSDITYVEMVEHRRGTGWVVGRCVELSQSYPNARWVVDGGGPASSLITDMQFAGLDVTVFTLRDTARSYASFMDALQDKTLIHGPQLELAEATRAARTRPCGDGGTAFGRRASDTDITALEAVSLAHWAAVTHPNVSVLETIW